MGKNHASQYANFGSLQDKISFGCEDDETCVTSQQTSDSFFVR